MFFIFGSPRSGTTLLAQCLSAHSDIVVPDETDFIIPMAFIADRITDADERRDLLKRFVSRTDRFPVSLGRYLTEAEVNELIEAHGAQPGRLIEEIYAAVARKAGKRLGGDKSPNDLLFLRILIQMGCVGPGCRIIHIVRDGRDVLGSLIEANFTSDIESFFPLLWNSTNLYLDRVLGHSEHYCLVRYEDLVAAPEQELERICTHLGVAYEPTMIDVAQHDPRHREDGKHKKLYQPISSANVGNYRKSLSDAIIARCEADAGYALAKFGYMPTKPIIHMP